MNIDTQDWTPVILNKKNTDTRNMDSKNTSQPSNSKNDTSNGDRPVKYRLTVPKDLGQMISQARNSQNKTQKILALELGISLQILSQWENGKFTQMPSNLQIANIERVLKTRLPRLQRIRITED